MALHHWPPPLPTLCHHQWPSNTASSSLYKRRSSWPRRVAEHILPSPRPPWLGAGLSARPTSSPHRPRPRPRRCRQRKSGTGRTCRLRSRRPSTTRTRRWLHDMHLLGGWHLNVEPLTPPQTPPQPPPQAPAPMPTDPGMPMVP
jgi:hypothetical protein